jgi:hypothetical protein
MQERVLAVRHALGSQHPDIRTNPGQKFCRQRSVEDSEGMVRERNHRA